MMTSDPERSVKGQSRMETETDTRTLRVRVNDELALDAGWWQEQQASDGSWQRIVHPPEKTMFAQVLDYLSSVPVEQGRGIHIGEEAVAATAVCLRWGTYLAVLADREKPLWAQARRTDVSRISDGEMARINIEASAALAGWIEIMRSDWDHYLELMWAACRLPMTRKTVQSDRPFSHLVWLAQPGVETMLASAYENAAWVEQTRAQVEAHPTRALANALVNACWRNGPVESIHAGTAASYPLTQRRITPSEERTLVRTTAGRLTQGVYAAFGLIHEQSERSWAERVLPFHLAPSWLVTPNGWSLEEHTRSVRLSRREDNH